MATPDPAYTPTVQGASSPEAAEQLQQFWQKALMDIKAMMPQDFKQQELPLARIKKIMKLDEDVKMISTEAPVLFAKATEIFIQELTLRAWLDTEDNKRRTLQRNDIAMAISKFDQFDFLIDIVPRDELKPTKRTDDSTQRASMMPDQVQYYFQLAQQHQAALQQQQTQPAQAQQQQQPQQVTIQAGQILSQPLQIQLATTQANTTTQTAGEAIQGQPQIIQIQAPVQQQAQQPQQQSQQQQQQQQQTTPQVFQQIVTPSGEIENVPLQLSPAQYQALQLQMQGKQAGQPIIIQTQNQNTQQQQQQTFAQPLFQVQQISNQFIQQEGDTQTDNQGDSAS